MHRRHLFAATALCILLSNSSSADTVSSSATAGATVQPGGPRTGTNGTNFFNVEGSNNDAFASFGVLDFNVSAFNLAFPATSVSNLKLALTESNSAFTTASGGLVFYLVTDTTTSIVAGVTPPVLVYKTENAPEGLGTQLGATPFQLGTGTFSTNSGSNGSGTIDTYSLTLSPSAQTYFLGQLNTANALLRMVVAPTDATGASTWAGATNSNVPTRPLLTFDVTLDQPSLIWVGGNGTWNATGGMNWSGGAWDPTKAALFNTGTGTVTLGTAVSATGISFNTTGYTVAGSGASVLTLSSAVGGNIITVGNAADTATISAEIAGTAGLAKSGAGTLAPTGTNTFTGTVAINGGVLAIGADSNLGNTANSIALNTGTLKSTAPLTIGAGRTLSGSGTVNAAAGAITFSGPINAAALTLTDNSSVTFSGSSAVFSSAVLGTGSTLSITAPVMGSGRTTFTGDGTVQLNGNNSAFGGGFQMSKGTGAVGPTVTMSSPTSLGTQTLFLNAGVLIASTDMTGAHAISTPISLGGAVTLSGSNMQFTGSFGFFGTSTKTFTINNNTTIDSAINTGGSTTDTLIKAGTGKLTLAALNGYDDGTQVLTGTLEVAAAGALGIGSVTISPAAILRLDTATGIDDASDLFFSSTGGTTFSMLNLNFGNSLFETVNSLTVDGLGLPSGTYNAASLPNFITGTGNLFVTVPEPNSAALLLLAGGLLVAGASGVLRIGKRRA